MDLRSIQAISGVAFGSFLSIHFINHFASPLGREGYDEALTFFRQFYQTKFLEPLVLGSALIHMACGYTLASRRPKYFPPAALSTQIQRITGWTLASIVIFHVAATRGPDWLNGDKYDYTGLHLTVVRLPYFFIPYYVIFAASGMSHLVIGLRTSYMRLVRPVSPFGPYIAIALAAGSLALATRIVLAFRVEPAPSLVEQALRAAERFYGRFFWF